MTTTDDTEVKVKRFKHKKVRKGLTIGIGKCVDGKVHNICITPKGSFLTLHHSKEDIEAEFVMSGLTNHKKFNETMCRCASTLFEWQNITKRFKNNLLINNVLGDARLPEKLAGALSASNGELTGTRIWRRYLKKAKYTNRHIKRVWPEVNDKPALQRFIAAEFSRVGLMLWPDSCQPDDKLSFKVSLPSSSKLGPGLDCWGHNRYVMLYNDEPPADIGPHRHSEYKLNSRRWRDTILEVSYPKKGTLKIHSSVSGLKGTRMYDKKSFDMVLFFVGQDLWKREASNQLYPPHLQTVDSVCSRQLNLIANKHLKKFGRDTITNESSAAVEVFHNNPRRGRSGLSVSLGIPSHMDEATGYLIAKVVKFIEKIEKRLINKKPYEKDLW